MEGTKRGAQAGRESHAPEPTSEMAEDVTQRRHVNLYDAVAGRVATTASLAGAPQGVRSAGGVTRLRDATLAPEDVLFQRIGAPQRYAEKDVYFSREAAAVTEADSRLLPDSDLLKAVHSYAAHLFEAVGHRRGVHGGGGGYGEDDEDEGRDPSYFVGSRHVDERSMDETALIAFGILLEEAGREVLGRRGDLVFTEGLDEEPTQTGQASGADGREPRPREVSVGPSDGETFWRRSYPKRRKRNKGGSARAEAGRR